MAGGNWAPTIRAFAVIGALALPSGAACASDNCHLLKPPPDSAVTGIHGGFFFVFPRTIENNYSGCQIQWDEHGNIWWVLRFERGKLVVLDARPQGVESGFTCTYKNEVPVGSDTKNCPEYEAVKTGVVTLPKNLEPMVPVDRDPRR